MHFEREDETRHPYINIFYQTLEIGQITSRDQRLKLKYGSPQQMAGKVSEHF